MPFDADKAGILDRLSPDGQKAALGQELLSLRQAQESLLETVDELVAALDSLEERFAGEQKFFARTALLKAHEAGTRVPLLAERDLGEDRKAYPLGFSIVLAGEVSWAGGTGSRVFLADSGTDLVYRFATIASSQLVAGTFLTPNSDGVTLEAEFGMSLGGRPGKGIDILADGNFGQGSDLSVTVYGYLA